MHAPATLDADERELHRDRTPISTTKLSLRCSFWAPSPPTDTAESCSIATSFFRATDCTYCLSCLTIQNLRLLFADTGGERIAMSRASEDPREGSTAQERGAHSSFLQLFLEATRAEQASDDTPPSRDDRDGGPVSPR